MMTITAAINSAASGMYAQQRRLLATADNIANALSAGYDRRDTHFSTGSAGGVTATVTSAQAQTVDEGTHVDLATEMLTLVETEISFKANASAFETGADLWDVLLSIKRD
ncbi:flagellar basal body protein [Rhizobium sp. SL42]|uniref:flagellar basal body protein n=1 Tax=Rhizobium sp. SL42 TaxID=2806346 RepID=UPI001F0197AA|nr:flagellar basal body protein [Rhizobium sp. SL42]UJW73910.1 flagellar basal body rod protein [Rhizobium sp. SL42]